MKLVKLDLVDIYVLFVTTMHFFSQSLNIVLRCRGVMLLHCVCWTRLIRTRIIVCSVSFHLLLSEFDIPDLREFVFQFSMAQVLVGLRKQFMNFSPTWACAAGFNNNNNNNIKNPLINVIRWISKEDFFFLVKKVGILS